MTTRADLEREREALRDLLAWGIPRGHITHPEQSALTASIARLDALLSLSDANAASVVAALDDLASEDDAGAHGCPDSCDATQRYRESASALRTIADLVRRTS